MACGELEGGEITLDEATAESTLEQTPSEVPSELDAASEAEEATFSGLQECRWEPTRGRLLGRFDLNGDGRLDAVERADLRESLEDLPPHARARARFALGRRMARVKFIRWVYDADGSQSLDEAEKELLRADLEARCDARASILLENFDSDGDGELSESEREAARDARRAQHRERFEARLAEADTDGNGELSREEKLAARELHRERVQARRDEIRGQFDLDGDGELSDEEREAARAWVRSGERI